jgi:hypothetical protein
VLEQEKEMSTTDPRDLSISTNGQSSERTLQRQWPQLGRELFALESALADPGVTSDKACTQQEQTEKKERLRDKIRAQLYRNEEHYPLDTRYRALLIVKLGRGGEIVGNPYYIDKLGKKEELPYTGLEGYYAGSQQTSAHTGLTAEEIVKEEANLGVTLLNTLKKQAIESYSWHRFARIKKALEGGELDVETVKDIRDLWAEVVRRLHVRVYNNKEFEATPSEQIEQLEQLLSTTPARTQEEKAYKSTLQEEYERMKQKRDHMSQEERAHEQKERKEKEIIRRERLQEYNHFRDETYELLKEAEKSEYDIRIQDENLKEATIIEQILLPTTRQRNGYHPVEVRLTPQQVEGYLFLARLGEVGGDPLARSMLISQGSVLVRKEASKG